MGTKSDPGEFDCYARAESDEPMFVLLARDPLAPTLVRQWAKLREETYFEHSGPLDARQTRKVDEARTIATDMEIWARNNSRGEEDETQV